MSYQEDNQQFRSVRMKRKRLRKKENNYILAEPDKPLIIIVAFLVIIGFLAIFSATAPKCMREGIFLGSFLIKQIIYSVAGFAAMIFFIKFDYKKLAKFNVPVFWTVFGLLFLVQFTPLGVNVNGAQRWINLGFIQLQPSELTKPLFCMMLASAFKDGAKILDLKTVLRTYLPLVIILLLILKQPNLSMAAILSFTGLCMFIAAKGSLAFVGSIAGIAGVGILSMLPKLLHGYQMDRITVWLNPGSDALGKGYNIIQSLIAFASGGFSGTGYGGSIQKLAYLPECHTDFIFAIIAEEFGFLGCLFIIGLFVALVHRGLRISKRCFDMYGKLLALGITIVFGFQAFLNMAVASSLFPVTGVTLPFISYGGTSIIVSLAMVGILLNISRQRIKKINAEEGEVNPNDI